MAAVTVYCIRSSFFSSNLAPTAYVMLCLAAGRPLKQETVRVMRLWGLEPLPQETVIDSQTTWPQAAHSFSIQQ
jgi:hypothetical protein